MAYACKMTLSQTVKGFTFRFHHTENFAYIKKILVDRWQARR